MVDVYGKKKHRLELIDTMKYTRETFGLGVIVPQKNIEIF